MKRGLKINIEFKYNKDSNSYIVSSQNGEIKIREYHPNMQEILVEENIIEEITEKLNSATNQKNNYLKTLAEIVEEKESIRKSYKRLQQKLLKWVSFALIVITMISAWLVGDISQFSSIAIFESTAVGMLIGYYSLLFGGEAKIENNHLDEKYQLAEEQLKEKEVEISELSLLLEQSYKRFARLSVVLPDKKTIPEISTEITPVDYRTILENRKLELQSMYQKTLIRKPDTDNYTI